MTAIVPVVGGQYTFAYRNELDVLFIGIFHTFNEATSSFDVDLYIEAETPYNEVPPEFISLLGLPDLRRRTDEPTRAGVLPEYINISLMTYFSCY